MMARVILMDKCQVQGQCYARGQAGQHQHPQADQGTMVYVEANGSTQGNQPGRTHAPRPPSPQLGKVNL
eukprot:3286977-Prorocentrum_lima.AAC.1